MLAGIYPFKMLSAFITNISSLLLLVIIYHYIRFQSLRILHMYFYTLEMESLLKYIA